MEVTLDDLAQVGKIIDAATQSGANLVQSLQYKLKNPTAVRSQAFREAAEQAKTSAGAIASGLGLKVAHILSAAEVIPEDEAFGAYKKVPPPPPLPDGTTPATPLEVGMIEVGVKVILRVEIAE